MEFDASPDELQFFLLEAEEQLQVLDNGLLDLERIGVRDDLLQNIFRAAHTLKGSSATIGHTRMATLTHHLEDIFDRLRQNRLDVSATLIDTGFEALDALRCLSEEVATFVPADVDVAPILENLALAQQSSVAGTNAPTTFEASVTFESDYPLKAARALQLALELSAGGQIVEMDPSQAEIEREEFDGKLQIVVVWPGGREQFERLLEETPGVARTEVTSVYAKASASSTDSQSHTVTVTFDEKNGLKAARALQLLLDLRATGHLIASRPSLAEIEAEQIGTTLQIELAGDIDLALFQASVNEYSEVVDYTIEEQSQNGVLFGTPRRVTPDPQEHPASRSRYPAQNNTVRVSVERIDRMLDIVGELVIERSRIADATSNLKGTVGPDPDIARLVESAGQIELLVSQIHEELMLGRMLPIDAILGKFPRLARDLGQGLGKEVEFDLDTGNVELDRSVLEAISDPVTHLVRNALDHGIETPEERIASGKSRAGRVAITARQVESRIVLTVSDDGRGLDADRLRMSAVEKGFLPEDTAARLSDAEAFQLIFRSGLSTVRQVTDVSGRGVGMDIVRKSLERIGATIEIDSAQGRGSAFRISLPLTLAIFRALLVRCDRWTFAIPLDSIVETVRLRDMRIHAIGSRHTMALRDQVLPMLHLSESLASGRRVDSHSTVSNYAIVVRAPNSPLGIVVDGLIGEQEIVVKPFGRFIPPVSGIGGATTLGDGSFAFIVDVGQLVKLEGVDDGIAFAA